jgi:Family of unknown function (DUF6200)
MSSTVADNPLVVELGRKKPKQIKKLRKGEGPLMDDVLQLLDGLRSDGKLGAGATPVVMVVKQKPRRRTMFGLG